MSVRKRLFFLTAPLLLLAAHARAQSRPEPSPEPPAKSQQVLTLRVTLPTAVGYAMRLLAKDDKPAPPTGRQEVRTNNPVLVFSVPVPQLLGGSKTDAPPTPKKD